MSRMYRFILLDGMGEAITEVALLCLEDPDALVVASHVGPRNHVQVFENDRFVGLVQSKHPDAAAYAIPIDDPPPVAATAPVAAAPIEPSVLEHLKVEPPVFVPDALEAPASGGPERAYNPFRRGAWRRRPGPAA